MAYCDQGCFRKTVWIFWRMNEPAKPHKKFTIIYFLSWNGDLHSWLLATIRTLVTSIIYTFHSGLTNCFNNNMSPPYKSYMHFVTEYRDWTWRDGQLNFIFITFTIFSEGKKLGNPYIRKKKKCHGNGLQLISWEIKPGWNYYRPAMTHLWDIIHYPVSETGLFLRPQAKTYSFGPIQYS